jgi:putative acetyltransferase
VADPEPFLLRTETPADRAGIDRVLRRAFGGSNAAILVERLRAEGGYDPGLSWVACEERPAPRIVGHVLFSPIAIVRGGPPAPALALAPLGVAPDRQRRGVGTALVRRGLAEARRRGHAIVLVLGDPGYYSRFGFRLAVRWRIRPPRSSWTGAFQALGLHPGALETARGEARYPAAFDEV